MVDKHFIPKETHDLEPEAGDTKIVQESMHNFKIRRVLRYQRFINIVDPQRKCYERDKKICNMN